MTAQNTSQVSFWLTTGAPSTATMSGPPAKADPTSISVTTSGGADGDVAVVRNVGWKSVDGVHIIDDWSSSEFDLLGADSTRETTTSAAGQVDHYKADDMTKLCPSSWTDSSTTPSTINVGTFCDPTQTIASQVADAGTMEISGYVDVNSADYVALYDAYELADQRYLKIDLGNDGTNNQGYLVAPVVALSMNWDIPLEGAVAYTLTFVKNSATKHRF
jgi:hypothetical protein